MLVLLCVRNGNVRSSEARYDATQKHAQILQSENIGLIFAIKWWEFQVRAVKSIEDNLKSFLTIEKWLFLWSGKKGLSANFRFPTSAFKIFYFFCLSSSKWLKKNQFKNENGERLPILLQFLNG